MFISLTYKLLFIPMKFFKRIQISIEYLETPSSLYSLTWKKLYPKQEANGPPHLPEEQLLTNKFVTTLFCGRWLHVNAVNVFLLYIAFISRWNLQHFPRMLCIIIRLNLPSGYGKEATICKSNQCNFFLGGEGGGLCLFLERSGFLVEHTRIHSVYGRMHCAKLS